MGFLLGSQLMEDRGPSAEVWTAVFGANPAEVASLIEHVARTRRSDWDTDASVEEPASEPPRPERSE